MINFRLQIFNPMKDNNNISVYIIDGFLLVYFYYYSYR